MNPETLAAELRRAGVAEVDAGRRRRAEYSTDASNYRVVPEVVVFPRHADEVAVALQVAGRTGVPLTARGGGTSCAGNAVGAGMVLDFSRHLNRLIALDPDARTATVEPGLILSELQRAAAVHRLRFGPDPSTQARCTIGGMIGNNACGPHALAYGRTADNVESLSLLLADGRGLLAGTLAGLADPVAARLSALVQANLGVIRTEFGRFGRQISGYSLEHLLPENGGRLARFLTGTEGTLAVSTAATVKLVELAPFTALAVLAYPDMATAADAVPAVLPYRPLALEGMDARLVEVLRNRRGPAAVPPLPDGGGWLFVETGGQSQAEAVAAAELIVRAAEAQDAAVVTGEHARRLWRIREDGAGLGGRTPANTPAWPGWEDAAVPPERLGGYLRDFFALLAQHRVDGLAYGHFGDGCVHVRLDFPLADRPQAFRAFLLDAATLVAAHGGSMSGEHGDGRARGELLPAMYSAEAIGLFGSVKAIFDPANLLNPGVIVDPAPVDADLRLPLARKLTGRLPAAGFSYPHDGGSFSTAVHRCVGVGKCRADLTAAGAVMCPSYLATRDETHSTRGRARVLQELANGELLTEGWRSPELLESLDLCLACKGCSSDCPAGVDMATYKAELLFQRYRRRLRPAAHYLLGWLPRWSRLATRAPRLANAALRPKPLAALAKRLGGIDQRRPLPAFAPRSFRDWFAEHPVADGDPVLLWVDTFTNAFAPEVGQAAVEVLEAAGCSVRITPEQVCCGLTWISTGQLDGARKQLARSFDALAPALEQGLPVVGLEPSCTAVLRADAVELMAGDDRAARVRDQTRTLAELLTERGWQPPSLRGVEAVVQPHCHQHAVLGFGADSALLTGAGAQLQTVGGCCGLAGNFGVERGHYEVSVAVAELALLPAVRGAGPDTVVLADGFSCRTQLDQLAGRTGLHLAQLLAAQLPAAQLPARRLPGRQPANPTTDRTTGFVPPPYPYERLGELTAIANRLEGGAVDLSIGTPCDPPPPEVIAALADAGHARGYPPSIGTPAFRAAAAGWIARRLGATVDPDAEVAACVGSKEFVASTPQYLKLRTPGRDTVLYPAVSYPTYEMGAILAGLRAVPYLRLADISAEDAERALCLWVNSPGNPTGELLDLAAAAAWGRARGVPVLSDECYAEFSYAQGPTTILREGTEGVLALHSLSKRDNFAGARIGFYAGDAGLVHYLREVRKHAGLMPPGPVQHAAIVALADDEHVQAQRDRYWRRMLRLQQVLAAVGLPVKMPDGAFYLWLAAPNGDAWAAARLLAERAGIVASPGEFYGPFSTGR